MTRLAVVIVCAMIAWWSAPAHACKFAQPAEYKPSPLPHDVTPPSAPVVESTLQPPKLPAGCGCGSCADIGRLYLKVSARDDQTAPNQLGYRIVVVRGGGLMMGWEAAALDPGGDGTFLLPYRDGLDITFEIRAVDRNGNVGPPTTITIDTRTAEEQVVYGKLVMTGVALFVLFVIGIRRRSRRSC